MDLVNKYENYKQRKGTENIGISKCCKEDAEEVNIYKCIEKYGMGQILNQTMAQQPLYLDNTNTPKTIQEAVEMQKQCEEYFLQLPARVRKVFDDNKDIFYQKYIKGEYADFLTTGVVTEDMINELQINKGDFEHENTEMAKDSTIDINVNTDSAQGDN